MKILNNYLHLDSFEFQVFHPEIWGICLLDNLGFVKQTPSLLPTCFNLLTADFLSFEKKVPIKNIKHHSLNNFRRGK